LFEALKVFTSTELRARKEVALKSYTLNAQIEAKVLIELVNTQIIPATLSYLGDLSSSVLKINEALSVTKSNYSLEMLSELNDQLSGLKSLNDELMSVLDTSEGLDSIEEKARYSCESIVPLMKELRLKADSLELVVADQLWPITKYRELLYIK
jgi:glutamine synthetase